MASRKKLVEDELRVKVPAQYNTFLEKYGIYEAPGIQVYGVSDNLLHYEGIPCVIGATKIYRRDQNLPHRYLVIYHTGIEDEMICLNTEDEKVYSISWAFGNRKIADSFDEWFQRDIVEYVKEREKRREQFDEDSEEIIDLDWMRQRRDDS